MYLDLERLDQRAAVAPPRWTVLIPFFNERDYLSTTIASLAMQDEPFELVLVDNGSTDGGAAVALGVARAFGLPVRLLVEPQPGKVAALKAGLALVRTRFVATCDADTIYPFQYLREAGRLLRRRGCVAAGAYFVTPDARGSERAREAGKILAAGVLLPGLCHAGGAGQCFDAQALRAAGGFDPATWDYVLEDHEVFHRVLAQGAVHYSRELWCIPSPRDRDRPSIRWTLLERLLYGVAGIGGGEWFFYRFLGPRLARRRLPSAGMRERTRADEGGQAVAPAHCLR